MEQVVTCLTSTRCMFTCLAPYLIYCICTTCNANRVSECRFHGKRADALFSHYVTAFISVGGHIGVLSCPRHLVSCSAHMELHMCLELPSPTITRRIRY